MATIDLETTKDQARKLLDFRIESVTDLVIARKRVDELREQLADAEREDKKAYVRATKDGWSEDELKKLGLETGGVAKRRSRRSASSEETPSPAPSTAANS
ncbi:hypothetical protein PTW37_17330 (plasmid) [Arthrobacter agilis]|uniref:hypothetical protein n=1 Tax=Arthrobacter agilis TaxID=37921 RepID=UPI0023653533|nr:hypothetical protein [Arthrobacter agilis]WDF35159.1 hypothetical protein PTW37_17330 [Arthrobacter agilis]